MNPRHFLEFYLKPALVHLFDYVRFKGQFALLEKEHKEALVCCTARSITKLFFQFDNVEPGASCPNISVGRTKVKQQLKRRQRPEARGEINVAQSKQMFMLLDWNVIDDMVLYYQAALFTSGLLHLVLTASRWQCTTKHLSQGAAVRKLLF